MKNMHSNEFEVTATNHPDLCMQLKQGTSGKRYQTLNTETFVLPADKGNGMIHIIPKSPDFFISVANASLVEKYHIRSIEKIIDCPFVDFNINNGSPESDFLEGNDHYTVYQADGNWRDFSMFLPKRLLPKNKKPSELKKMFHRFSTNPYIVNSLTSIHELKKLNFLNILQLESKSLEIAALWLQYLQIEGAKEKKICLTDYHKNCISEAKELLDDDQEQPITIKYLARKVGLSESILKTGFRELFGTTIRQYVIQLRMEKSRVLLKETNLPISRVCQIVGYNHQGHFSEIFRRNYGTSPYAFRQSQAVA